MKFYPLLKERPYVVLTAAPGISEAGWLVIGTAKNLAEAQRMALSSMSLSPMHVQIVVTKLVATLTAQGKEAEWKLVRNTKAQKGVSAP